MVKKLAVSSARSSLLVFAALALLACAAGKPAQVKAPAATAAPQDQAQSAQPSLQPAPEPDHPGQGQATLHTTEGPITITFFPDVAPQTVNHLTELMKAGCYQGVDIFRLEPGFVVQVAPVANRDCHRNAMSTVPAEFSKVEHKRLYLSMARWEDVDSGTSSWSIMLGPVPSMNGQYTVFGRVIAGQETIEKIEAIGSTKGEDGMSRLNRSVTIERVELSE